MNLTQVVPMSPRQRKEAKRFVKFATVGAIGSVTDFTVLNILVHFFGFLPVVANVFSVSTAMIQNFVLNRYWTFPESRRRQATSQLAQFVLVSVVGVGINTLVFYVVDRMLQSFWIDFTGSADLGFTVSYNFAKLFAIGVVLFWNFAANRLWTYRGL